MRQYMGSLREPPGNAELKSIGVIHSPYFRRGDAPRQGRLSDQESAIEILPEYAEGLQDVEIHPHLIVLYWLDRADRGTLKATPPGTCTEHGVFATRSPDRPNPIAFSVVDVVRRDGNRLVVRGLDALDGTPLLDLKPFIAAVDCVKD